MKTKEKKKNQVRTCAVVVQRSGCDVGHMDPTFVPCQNGSGRATTKLAADYPCGPHTAEAKRGKGISRNPKKETFGYCRKLIVGWPSGARALTSKPRRERWGEAGVKMKNFLISVRCPPIKIMWPLSQQGGLVSLGYGALFTSEKSYHFFERSE